MYFYAKAQFTKITKNKITVQLNYNFLVRSDANQWQHLADLIQNVA